MSQLGVGEGITRWQVFLSQSLCQTVHREHAPATETQPALGCGVGAIYIGIPQPGLGSGVAAVFITTQQCCLGIAHPTLGQLFPCPWCLWKQKAAICYMGELGTSPSLSYSAPGQLRPQARQRKEAALSASPPHGTGCQSLGHPACIQRPVGVTWGEEGCSNRDSPAEQGHGQRLEVQGVPSLFWILHVRSGPSLKSPGGQIHLHLLAGREGKVSSCPSDQ